MTIEEIRVNAPSGAEMYRVKNGKTFYYKYDKNPRGWRLLRHGVDGWSFTRLIDQSELKPL